ncbi:MAG: hypothetical protein V3W41_04530 [Planctomycetota bacterium]
MRFSPLALLLASALTLGSTLPSTWAQNDPAIGESINDISLGEYWYGKQIDKRDLVGKVVLMEIWGS